MNEEFKKIRVLEYHVNDDFSDDFNWFSIHVSGYPRSQLQELSRHTFAKSIESSRYTLKKHLKGNGQEIYFSEPGDNREVWGKYIWLTGNYDVDKAAHVALAKLASLIENGASNDSVKTLVPEGLRYSGVMTFTLKEWNNIVRLRSGKDVYQPFREFVHDIQEELYKTKPIWFIEDYSELLTGSQSCRVCWDSDNNSDNGGEKDQALLKKVTMKYKHQSILEHLKIRTSLGSMILSEIINHNHYRKYIETDNKLILINMRTIVEILEDKDFYYRQEIIDEVPNEWKYLIEDIL